MLRLISDFSITSLIPGICFPEQSRDQDAIWCVRREFYLQPRPLIQPYIRRRTGRVGLKDSFGTRKTLYLFPGKKLISCSPSAPGSRSRQRHTLTERRPDNGEAKDGTRTETRISRIRRRGQGIADESGRPVFPPALGQKDQLISQSAIQQKRPVMRTNR